MDKDLSIRLRTDSLQFWKDHVESFDGLLGVSDSGRVGSGVSLSVLLDELQVLVDDDHLVLEGADSGLEIGDLISQRRDLFDGEADIGGGRIDSLVEVFDSSFAFSFSLSLQFSGFLLLSNKIAVDARQKSGDVGQRSFVLHLDGNCVQ